MPNTRTPEEREQKPVSHRHECKKCGALNTTPSTTPCRECGYKK